MKTYDIDGTHVIADFYGVENCELLDNKDELVSLIKDAIKISGATLIDINAHKFEPQGITVTAILSESSCTLHGYPEHCFMSVDFYTCGKTANPLNGINFLKDVLNPEHCNIISIGRGSKESIDLKIIK